VLETFRTGGKSREQIEVVRREIDKDKRSEMKQRLPAVVFSSEPQPQRKVSACKPNGILCLDFDGIPADELASAKTKIAEVPFVFVVGYSVSNTGIFALVAYAESPDLKKLLVALQPYFPDYELDKSCSDISRLRFVTLDEKLVVKNEVRPVVLTEQIEPVIDYSETEYESKQMATSKPDNVFHADDADAAEPLPRIPFPVDCLPVTLARWATDTQRCINLKDPSMPAIAALAVISSVIGSSCRIEIKPGYTEPAALNTAIVLDTGGAKSPVIEAATKYLETLQSEKIKQWRREVYESEQELAEWQSTPKNQRGSKPMAPPPAERFIIKDITVEAVAGILENNKLGVLLNRDELNGFFAGMDAYRQKATTDLQSWMEIYEGRGLTVDRKTTGTVYIDKPSVSIIGGIQRPILKQTVQKRAEFFTSGYGSRFLYVMPEKEPIVWNLNSPDVGIVAAYENLIERILINRECTLEKDDTGINAFATVKPFVFTLSDNARRVLFKFQERYARQAPYENAANAAAMNKAGRIAARICLTLHCVRSIETKGYLLGLDVVSEQTAKNAVAIADWFIHESERVIAMLAGGRVVGDLTEEQKAVMKVLEKWEPATEGDLKEHGRVVRRIENLTDVLRQLKELGIIQKRKREGNGVEGREITEYFIVRSTAVPEPPINPDDFGGSGYGYSSNAPENYFFAPDETEVFVDDWNPELAPDFNPCWQEEYTAAEQETTVPVPPMGSAEVENCCRNCQHYDVRMAKEWGLCHKKLTLHADCSEFRAAESAVAPDVNPSELADIFRHTLHREPGKNAVFFDDILSCFDGDRVPASTFLNEFGFVLEEIDGQLRVMETRKPESAPEPPPVAESVNSESTSVPPPEQTEATEFRCESEGGNLGVLGNCPCLVLRK
jgi:hypothetical protein